MDLRAPARTIVFSISLASMVSLFSVHSDSIGRSVVSDGSRFSVLRNRTTFVNAPNVQALRT